MKKLSTWSSRPRDVCIPFETTRPKTVTITSSDSPVTQLQIENYLESMRARNCAEVSVKKYEHDLDAFYQFLPEDKRITRTSLEEWRAALLEKGYAPRTVNSVISVANGFLGWLGWRECQLLERISIADDAQPELTWNEYHRLLSAARALGKERAYLLVKVFANIDLTVQELPQLTVEAMKESRVMISSNSAQRIVYVPATLREELGNYIRCTGILSGPVFVTRSGRQLNRTAVTAAIQGLSHDARVLPEKCNPRCLRKLYQSTMAGIEASVRLLVEQTHDRLLEQEQLTVGWEAREPPPKKGKRCSTSGAILKDKIKGGEENNETKIPIRIDGADFGAVADSNCGVCSGRGAGKN